MAVITRTRWQTLSRHLDRALDLPARERDAMVDALAAEDPALAGDLRRLVDGQKSASRAGFLSSRVVARPALSFAGHRIGAYTLVSPIGRGGMGTVWRATRSDGRFEGTVAIKLLNPGLIGRTAEARFTREGSILARLRHPHIARLIDAGVTVNEQPYLVLEYVEGEHIDRYCQRHALGIDARVRLFLDVLDAVAHAHANLIVHRDVKPSNVLVAADGEVKLLDFGIAKLIDADAERAGSTTIEGRPLTPEYAAPEQLTGGAITTATDVYALGMLLYGLLGGTRPSDRSGRAPVDWLKSVVETELPRLSEASPEGKRLRGDLETIVARALKKAPAERYPSVTAMADDLRRYLRHEPVLARPDTFTYRAAKFLRRRRRGVAIAVASTVAAASLVAFYTARLESERNHARVEAEKSQQIAELLTGLLTGADPYGSRSGEPTVRGILEAGAQRIGDELRDQPAVRAEMLTVIGRTYQRLGDRQRAAPLLEQALAIERTEGHADAQLAQTLNDLGVLRREAGTPQLAIPLLEEALAVRRRVLGSGDKDVAVTLVELGRARQDRGEFDRAEALFREALAIRRKVFGDAHRETATSKSALGLLLLRRGDGAGAAPLLRDALDTSRAVLPADHPNVGSSLNNLGLVLLDTGDYAAAEPLFRQALAIREKQFGLNHASLGPTLSNLAVALREQRHYDEARQLLERALAITPPGDAAVAGFEVHLARVYLAERDPAGAEHLLRDAFDRQQRSLDRDDWRLAATQGTLGTALLRKGHYDEARRLLTDASRRLKDVPGRQGREAAAVRASLDELAAVDRRAVSTPASLSR